MYKNFCHSLPYHLSMNELTKRRIDIYDLKLAYIRTISINDMYTMKAYLEANFKRTSSLVKYFPCHMNSYSLIDIIMHESIDMKIDFNQLTMYSICYHIHDLFIEWDFNKPYSLWVLSPLSLWYDMMEARSDLRNWTELQTPKDRTGELVTWYSIYNGSIYGWYQVWEEVIWSFLQSACLWPFMIVPYQCDVPVCHLSSLLGSTIMIPLVKFASFWSLISRREVSGKLPTLLSVHRQIFQRTNIPVHCGHYFKLQGSNDQSVSWKCSKDTQVSVPSSFQVYKHTRTLTRKGSHFIDSRVQKDALMCVKFTHQGCFYSDHRAPFPLTCWCDEIDITDWVSILSMACLLYPW